MIRFAAVALLASLTCLREPARAADLPPHPRLLLTPAAETRIRARIEADPVVAMIRDAVLVSARNALDDRTCEHRIPDGKRLLAESRRAISTVLHTAAAWRLTGERRYFERCVTELDAACGLPDWNPSHFLDVAEMATAVALGFDWLHADLTPEQRTRYTDALRAKALTPVRAEFDRKVHWIRVHNNWSQVCGAGIMAACAAVADDDETLATLPFADCLAIVERSARFYEPDGGYPEGPGYWDYGTEYHVLSLAIAAGLGRPIETPRHLLAAASFMAHIRGPTDLFFNFADARAASDRFVSCRGWLIDHLADAALAADLRAGLWNHRESLATRGGNDRFFPLHLLWLPDEPAAPAPALPVAAAFDGQQPVAMLRSKRNDPQALFVAAKGGTPAASHGHMDVGSFVVEAAGRRWIHDLGGDSYNLPGYFGTQRWDYFRLNARSHNVPLIGRNMQNPKCEPCRIVSSRLDQPPYAVRFDLTPAYTFGTERLADRIEREVTLDPEANEIRVRDTIVEPADAVRWQCLIDVRPELEGNRATLARDGQSITMAISPPPATWLVAPATAPTPQERQNDGFQLLHAMFAPPLQGEPLVIEVVIRPGG